MDDGNASARRRLSTIADLLGISTDRFYEAASDRSRADLSELNYLYHRLRTPEGRAAALDALNRILDEEGS